MQKSTLLVLTTIATAAVEKYKADFAAGRNPTVLDIIINIKNALWREVSAETPDGSDAENIVCGLIPQTSPQSIKTGEYVKTLTSLDRNIAKIILGTRLLDGEMYLPAGFDMAKEIEEFKSSFISELNKK